MGIKREHECECAALVIPSGMACCACAVFVLIAWFLFFCKWSDSTFKTQPPWKSRLATNDGAPCPQGLGGLLLWAPALLLR